jgi:hypothetical protein
MDARAGKSRPLGKRGIQTALSSRPRPVDNRRYKCGAKPADTKELLEGRTPTCIEKHWPR